jgi:uncharacterized damage-inducible protein DinB
MPVPNVIANAAENYRFNSDFLAKMVGDLSPEEWLNRPNEKANHIAWIVGHVMWARRDVLIRLDKQWSPPWLDLFAKGGKCSDGAPYPSSDALLDAWREVSSILASALGSVSEEVLSQPAKNGPPSPDGKISGVVNFLAIHETYHVGQVSYLRGWLGHMGLMG